MVQTLSQKNVWNVPELDEDDENDNILDVISPMDTHVSDSLDAQMLNRDDIPGSVVDKTVMERVLHKSNSQKEDDELSDDDIEEFINTNETELENDSDVSENDESE